jgi:hypothetical protein
MKFLTSKDGLKAQELLVFEEKDIFTDLMGDKGSSLLLGKYSIQEVFSVLKKRNFFKDAQNKGLWPLEYDLDSSEYPLQRFRIFYREKKPENLMVDLKLREAVFRLEKQLAAEISASQFKFLSLDWLTLQDPLLEFSGDLLPLPGQNHPGLKLGKKVLDLFVYLARLNRLDGILAFPAYFHNALLFSRQFIFLNPLKQGEVLAIRKTFRNIPFRQLAWIVHLECIREKSLGLYKWEAEEQVHPLNKILKDYFDSRYYKKRVRESEERRDFSIDWECFEKKYS